MDNTRERLAGCFQAVFPGLRTSEVAEARQDSVAAWDSVAAVTLASTVEEEFDVQVDFDQIADLDSFERWLEYVNSVQKQQA